MDLIRTITPHVSGISEHLGGSGDPSPATALGVLWAMKAVAERLWGDAVAGGPPRQHQRGGQGGRCAGRPPPRRGCPAHGGRRPARPPPPRSPSARAPTWCLPRTPTRWRATSTRPARSAGRCRPPPSRELRTAAVVGCANNQLATPQDAQRIDECRCAVRARLRRERGRSDQHRRGEGWLRSGPCRGAHPGDPRHRPPRARPRRRRGRSPPRRRPTCWPSAASTRPDASERGQR